MHPKYFVYFFFSLLLSACTEKCHNINILNSFEDLKGKTILITHLSGLSHPHYYDSQTLEILELHEGNKDIHKALQKISSNEILKHDYYQCFSHHFHKESLLLRLEEDPLNRHTLRPFPLKNCNYAPYDFRFLRKKYAVDYVLILDPVAFGVEHFFYRQRPLGDPMGCAYLEIYLVNLQDNTIRARCSIVSQEPLLSLSENHVSSASQKALSHALHEANFYILGWKIH